MTTAQTAAPSIHILDACPLRPEDIANENYAADLHRALSKELAAECTAREFFQSPMSPLA